MGILEERLRCHSLPPSGTSRTRNDWLIFWSRVISKAEETKKETHRLYRIELVFLGGNGAAVTSMGWSIIVHMVVQKSQ